MEIMEIKNPRILIYDEDNIRYITGFLGFINENHEPEYVEYLNGNHAYLRPLSADFNCSVSSYEELNNIELDETTMKRIAKYNKEVDIKKLDEEIEEKKEKIQRLEAILEDREKRVDMLKKYIAQIYEIDIKEDDEEYDYFDD